MLAEMQVLVKNLTTGGVLYTNINTGVKELRILRRLAFEIKGSAIISHYTNSPTLEIN